MITDHLGYVVLNSPQYNIKAFGANHSNADNKTEIQNCINSVYRVSIIGDSVSEIYRHSQTLIGASNKTYIVNGELKVSDASIVLLESDLLTGATSLVLTNASTYFKTGDLVCITSNARSIQGGGNAKDRREGQAFTITVSGNNISLDTPAVIDYLVSDSAKIGHTHSCINFLEKENFIVDGTGVVNNNWENLFNVEPTPITVAYSHGNAITTYKCNNFKIKNVTFKNGLVANLGISFKNRYFEVDSINSVDAHDKCLLLYGYSSDINQYFTIKKSRFTGALYEDGITVYTQTTDGSIENNTIENCSRYGIITNATTARIDIKDNNISDCGQPLVIKNASNTFSGINTIKGTGYFHRVPSVKKVCVYIDECNGGNLKGLTIDQTSRTAPLIYVKNSNNWILDDLLLEKTNDVALQMTSSSAMIVTLKNSTLRGNGTNYSLDANSTLIKENVIEE